MSEPCTAIDAAAGYTCRSHLWTYCEDVHPGQPCACLAARRVA